jgi:diguanylate cyclase (GGDEF)-like protein
VNTSTPIAPDAIPVRIGVAHRFTGAQRVWLLTATLVLVAAAILAAGSFHEAPRILPIPVPWPLIAAAFFVAEVRVVHLHIGRSAHSFSMAEIPFLFGLFFLSPLEFVAARLVGAGLALFVARRQRSAKLAFNLAQFLLGSAVAVSVIKVMVPGGTSFGVLEWVAAYTATLFENVVSVVAIATAITLAERRSQFRRIPVMLRMGLLVSATNASLGLLAIVVLEQRPDAALLFLVPIGVAFVAYRAYVAQRVQKEGLEMLYESTRILQRSPNVDRALAELLGHVRAMFRADLAELTLLPEHAGDQYLRQVSRSDDADATLVPIGLTVDDPLLEQVIASGRGIRIASPDPELAPRFRNALIAPLVGEHRSIGAFVVANRVSDISTFDESDLRLFETLASHVAVSLENGQLEESLRRLAELKEELHHQASHDSLTGLANRSTFQQVVDARLAVMDPGGRVLAVLFLDLDDFKLVNDTRGHLVGDRLLHAVGDRIASVVRGEDVAARLGGDEFAVMLWDREDLAGTHRLADRLITTLAMPYTIDRSQLSIHASIGLAAAASPMSGADDLMRKADVAMYAAKANGKGCVVAYEPGMGEALAHRTRTTDELRVAIQDSQLVLHYQPIFEIESRRIVGVEALVRWNHPVRGLVMPLEFIDAAERAGLIRDLGRWVMRETLRQLGVWREMGDPFDSWWVSVNVSPGEFTDPGFVDELAELIERAGIRRGQIALEMTETGVVANAPEAAARLHAIRDLGLGLLIDDFGTGYSSLSYLRHLPVTGLKIAREFIDLPADGEGGWGLASAIIAMGRTLGLDVIAEGVEQESQLARLEADGCPHAQGFLLARPVPGGELVRSVLADVPAVR